MTARVSWKPCSPLLPTTSENLAGLFKSFETHPNNLSGRIFKLGESYFPGLFNHRFTLKGTMSLIFNFFYPCNT